ncbi:MAG: hypothetical protein M3296_07235 [Actinomycetota bacterium]|nr:hypothetical protein [Actinomycetota bacterium]
MQGAASSATPPVAQDHLSALEAVALEDSSQRVARALEAAREVLGMDISYFSELTQTEQVVLAIMGDASSFGFDVGSAFPLEATYCRRMVAGEIDNAVPDAAADAVVRDLPVTREADLGAYLGVPVHLSTGASPVLREPRAASRVRHPGGLRARRALSRRPRRCGPAGCATAPGGRRACGRRSRGSGSACRPW